MKQKVKCNICKRVRDINRKKIIPAATDFARMTNQTIGEKKDYYITLTQLMDLLQGATETL